MRLHHPIHHRLRRHQHQHLNRRQHRHQQHQRRIRIQPAEAAVLQVLLLTALQARVQVLIQAPVLYREAQVIRRIQVTRAVMTVRRSMTRMMLMIMMMQMILQMTGRKNSATVIMMTDTMMPMITGKTRWMIKHLEYVGQMI